MENVFERSLEDFLQYVKTIRYGYRDVLGGLHTCQPYDFERYPYAFSAPEEVMRNRCGWCWDVCELIRVYARKNGIPVRMWFFEYRDGSAHFTHTQAVIERNGLWHMVPDNSDPHDFDENNGAPLDALAERMAGYFREYVKSAAEGPIREDAFLIREYSGSPESGMSDEDVLRLLRNA